jgi:hypothetical protein
MDEADRDLLRAYAVFMKGAQGMANELPHGDLPGDSRLVTLLLLKRLFRLADGIGALIRSGNARQTRTLARTMISAAVNLMYIHADQPATRAYWFRIYGQRGERSRLQIMKKNQLEAPAQLDALWAEREKYWREVQNAARAAGLAYPPPLKVDGKRRPPTWSRRTDADMAKAVGAEGWYDLHYKRLSDDGHVNILSLMEEAATTYLHITELDTRLGVSLAVETITESLRAVAKTLGQIHMDVDQPASTIEKAVAVHRSYYGREKVIDLLERRSQERDSR